MLLMKRQELFVAIEDKYHGLIPSREILDNLKFGESIEARVSNVRNDGKLILSLRKKAYGEIDSDAEKILLELKNNSGVLPFGDKSSPNQIKKDLG